MLTEKEGVCWCPEEEIDKEMRGMEGLTSSQTCGLVLSPLEGGAGEKPRALCAGSGPGGKMRIELGEPPPPQGGTSREDGRTTLLKARLPQLG